MAENRPRARDRKLGMIAPLSIAVAIVLVILGATLFAQKPDESPPPAGPDSATIAAPVPPAPAPDPTLLRADLTAAAAEAADAYASGRQRPPGKDPLVGRPYVLRIPFGCEGPQIRPGAAQAFYELDTEKRTVRLVARPATWTSLPLIQDTTPTGALEAVEGFWIPQPWTNAEACPASRDKPVPASPTPPAAETLGLARLFETGGSRVERRGDRPYEQVIRLKPDEPPPGPEGYLLVLEGRLAAFPDGRAAHCWSESAAHRPTCLFAATFERVAFETVDGRRLAEWREGS